MKYLKFSLLIFAIIITVNSNITAQASNIKKIAITNFKSESIDRSTLNSVREILKYEIQKISDLDVVLSTRNNDENFAGCNDIDCAVEEAENVGADHAVICSFLQLGQKLIIQYSLIDVEEKRILLQDNMTSTSVEELDVIMQRIAMSITEFQPISRTAQIGTLTEHETKSPLERLGRRFFGFSFGYLYPETGFDNTDRSFTMDYKVGAELLNFDYGLQVFARKGFGVNIFSSYLFSRKDICPYLGLGAGFHWVEDQRNYYREVDFYGNSYYDSEKVNSDGFELTANAGLRLFHTYSMRLTLNVSYSHTFNDYGNDAVIITFGFLK